MSEWVFADDIVLITNNETNLQYNVNIRIQLLEEERMKQATCYGKTHGYRKCRSYP